LIRSLFSKPNRPTKHPTLTAARNTKVERYLIDVPSRAVLRDTLVVNERCPADDQEEIHSPADHIQPAAMLLQAE